MNHRDQWLAKLQKLNKARNNAPHKPLLLLVMLEMAERGLLSHARQSLTPGMAFLFDTYASVVVHRRTQRPDIRMPFHHLSTQGFWTALTETNDVSKHRAITSQIQIDAGFYTWCMDHEFRSLARHILIATHFEPAERNALYNLVGLDVPADDEVARHATFKAGEDAAQVGRNGRFRLDVISAYQYACALTGYRLSTRAGVLIVDAAHIHRFSDSRNNDCRNGLALCKNAHWLFDCGLWSVDDNYCILVATEHFQEETPDQKSLCSYQGKRLRLPNDEVFWPDREYLQWHRANCFVG